jgi:hypothetical protein
MASNRELSESAEALGKELGIDVDTKGLNHQSLMDLVAGLERRKAAGKAPPLTAPSAKPPEAPAAPEKPARPPIDGASDGSAGGPPPKPTPKPVKTGAPYSVAPGRSLVCRRGVLASGEEIFPSDVGGGKEQLEQLVQSGHVVKR